MKSRGQSKQARRGADGASQQGAMLEELYGPVDWRNADGVLHVTAIAAADRTTIALGPEAPQSATDRFVLGFARARADALVTTASVLRAEPELVHCYAEEADQNAEWRVWREVNLGCKVSPGLIVLSRTGDFPRDHPAIEAAGSGFVWTSAAGRSRLGSRIGQLEVVAAEGIADGHTGLANALVFAQERGLARLTIEAGPSATRALYEPDPSMGAAQNIDGATPVALVAEVLLSLFQGDLVDSARAGEFASEEHLGGVGLRRVSSKDVQEPSGAWSFQRYRVASGRGRC